MDKTWWFHFFGYASAGTLGLGFITGIVSVWLSWQINAEQKRELAEITRQIEEERKETARAQESTAALSLRVQEESRKRAEAEAKLALIQSRQAPRRLLIEKFLPEFRGKPKGSAVIVYLQNDPEAFDFALEIMHLLHGAGWPVTFPKPVSEHTLSKSVPALRAGVTIATRFIEPPGSPPNTPFRVLEEVFLRIGQAVGFGVSSTLDETLDQNTFRIEVGPKP
jgi:hypothetical protein